MKFDMKTPCNACPFIRGSITNTSLAEGRIEEIVDAIRHEATFTCHKTLQLPKEDQQHCAGAMIFLEKEERPNQMMRIMGRLRLYDHKKLDMDADVIDEF